jgi:hypothetical protein
MIPEGRGNYRRLLLAQRLLTQILAAGGNFLKEKRPLKSLRERVD